MNRPQLVNQRETIGAQRFVQRPCRVPNHRKPTAALWTVLGDSRIPTLLVRGADSPFTTDEDAAEFLRRSPSAQVCTVIGAGHSVQSDRPTELARIIEQFAYASGSQISMQ